MKYAERVCQATSTTEGAIPDVVVDPFDPGWVF